MTSKEIVLSDMKARGKEDALNLRSRASIMTGTEIIAEKTKIPPWKEDGDYSDTERWPAGSPVTDEGRTYGLIINHVAAHYPGYRPSDLPAIWSPKHTTNPAEAEEYLPPNGTSGMYMLDECCTENGKVYRSIVDNGVYAPSEYAGNWEDLGEVGSIEVYA